MHERLRSCCRRERTPVLAVLLDDVPRTATSGMGRDLASARVRWTTSNGSTHSGMTLVATGKKAGSTARIWIDTQGRLSTRPPTPGKAAAEAGVFGASAALALSGVVSGIGASAVGTSRDATGAGSRDADRAGSPARRRGGGCAAPSPATPPAPARPAVRSAHARRARTPRPMRRASAVLLCVALPPRLVPEEGGQAYGAG